MKKTEATNNNVSPKTSQRQIALDPKSNGELMDEISLTNFCSFWSLELPRIMINLRRRSVSQSHFAGLAGIRFLLSNTVSVALYRVALSSGQLPSSVVIQHTDQTLLIFARKKMSWKSLKNIFEKILMYTFDKFFREIVMAWISAKFLLQKTQQTNSGKVAQSVFRISKF